MEKVEVRKMDVKTFRNSTYASWANGVALVEEPLDKLLILDLPLGDYVFTGSAIAFLLPGKTPWDLSVAEAGSLDDSVRPEHLGGVPMRLKGLYVTGEDSYTNGFVLIPVKSIEEGEKVINILSQIPFPPK